MNSPWTACHNDSGSFVRAVFTFRSYDFVRCQDAELHSNDAQSSQSSGFDMSFKQVSETQRQFRKRQLAQESGELAERSEGIP